MHTCRRVFLPPPPSSPPPRNQTFRPTPTSFFGLNVFFTILTQLIPLMYFVILYRVRHLLHPPSNRSAHSQLRDRQRREQGHELKPISFLFEHYGLGWWYFEVIESYRRVAFISLLALIPDKTLAGFVGIFMSSMSTAFYREAAPYHLASNNVLATVANQQLSFTFLSATLLRTTRHGDNAVGGSTLLAMNVAIIPCSIIASWAEHKKQSKAEEIKIKFYEKLKHAEAEDKKKFDIAWTGYTKHAADTGNANVVGELKANLAALDRLVGGEVVTTLAHPQSLASTIDELMEVAMANNDMLHEVVRGVVEAMNGLYQQGPVKQQERVQEKSDNDYKGDFLKVVDIVRSSAVFHALLDFHNALLALKAPGGKVKKVRSKD